MKEVKMGMGRIGGRFLKERRELRLLGLMYANDVFMQRIGRGPEDNGGMFF